MKKRLSLSAVVIIIFAVIGVLCIVLSYIYHSSLSVVPNRDKFSYNADEYGAVEEGEEPVGDGTYAIKLTDSGEKCFIMQHTNKSPSYDTVLSRVYETLWQNEILYCYSADGFAVVYPENNIAKVLLSESSDIGKVLDGTKGRNKLVIYLDDFEEYTSYEKKMLNKLIKAHEKAE